MPVYLVRVFRLLQFSCKGVLGLIALLQVFTNTVDAADRNIELIYDISWGKLRLAEATSQWQIKEGKATILGTVKSDGVARLLSGFDSASIAEIVSRSDGWQPKFLTLSRVTKSKQITSSVHWSATGDILSDVQQPPLDLEEVVPITEKLKLNVIDPYSVIMRQFDHISDYEKCAGSYEVYDGLRRFELQFETVGLINLVADRPFSFDGDALHCKIYVMPKGGHRITSKWHKKPLEDRQVSIYFGRFANELIIPVRAEIEARMGTGVARLDIQQSKIQSLP